MEKQEAKQEAKTASLEELRANPSAGQTEMVRNSVSLSPPKPSWFTPKRYPFFFVDCGGFVFDVCLAAEKMWGMRGKEKREIALL